MATTRTKAAEAEEDTTEENGKYRLSISLDTSLRRNIRIAAAYNDMEVGEWCARVLGIMAEKAIEDQG